MPTTNNMPAELTLNLIDRPNVLTKSLIIYIVFNADIDECALGMDDCSENAICTNIPGNFSCMCDEGYDGDGTTCVGKLVK